MKKETICYDEAITISCDGEEAKGMSCMGISISDYINSRNKK